MFDNKDRRILYELSKNSRVSAPAIDKSIRLSKDSIIYRINNLARDGIVQKFVTVVNIKALGYRTHVIFLEFRKFDTKTEKAVARWLVKYPYTIWVASSSGKWDLIVDIISKDQEQFDRNLMEIFNKLGKNLNGYEVLETIKEYYYNHKYLTGQSFAFEQTKAQHYSPDKTDYLILEQLSQSSRLTSVEIAEKIKVSHDTVSYRIKKLLEAKIIEQFTVIVDFSKLNLSYYVLLLQFSGLTEQKEKEIANFLKAHKEVLFFAKTAGKYNFLADLVVDGPAQVKEFLSKLREAFGEILESRETFLMFEQQKNDYFPEGILNDFKS